MNVFDALGFSWNRNAGALGLPRHSVERAVFRMHRMLPQYVWDAGVLEGNPFTFPEVKTLLEGVTVGGRKLSDQEQIANLAEASKHLMSLVKHGKFVLDKATFCDLHAIVARHEALEWGHFRGEEKDAIFNEGVRALEAGVPDPVERGIAFFLFGALQQFFFDGNKRTSRFMMNGVLMSQGIDAISIPASRAQEFNTKMVDFYVSREGTEMMRFVVGCAADA
jgi:Fic family protein